jgi:hypothetical protein
VIPSFGLISSSITEAIQPYSLAQGSFRKIAGSRLGDKAIVRRIEELEEANLIIQKTDPDDRRRTRLYAPELSEEISPPPSKQLSLVSPEDDPLLLKIITHIKKETFNHTFAKENVQLQHFKDIFDDVKCTIPNTREDTVNLALTELVDSGFLREVRQDVYERTN